MCGGLFGSSASGFHQVVHLVGVFTGVLSWFSARLGEEVWGGLCGEQMGLSWISISLVSGIWGYLCGELIGLSWSSMIFVGVGVSGTVPSWMGLV